MPDVVVVGGGIAGISVAAALSGHTDVVLVEREPVLSYHTTGRSAAVFMEGLGSQAVRPLTRASKPFLFDPPVGLVDGALLSSRGILYIARDDQLHHLDDEERANEGGFVRISGEEVCALQPAIRPGYAVAGLHDATAMDLDVAGLHQAYVRRFRANGGRIDTSAPVVGLDRLSEGWRVSTSTSSLEADVVVNAAGAWGDVVAGMAGVAPLGLQPLRRTAFMVAADPALADTPMAVGADFGFYFKPDGPQMLCSLGEEEPDEPCDARPREIDVALAIDRINDATTLEIRHVRSSWTGLRTFAPDGAPVIGFDPDHPGFFWLVGQGGTGIQTAPGAAALAASLIIDGSPPPAMVADGLDLAPLDPARFG